MAFQVVLVRFLFLVCLIHSLQCSEEEGSSTESQPATTEKSGSGNSQPLGSVGDTLMNQIERLANNINPTFFINIFRKIFNNS
ncbi:hypothetical protein KGM_211060 [Danaus plexippus plexippus]|uniref:Uncharacterized protein n=1 Tax=Danaus plexippus plexippus TaxID=278856 RepID=A0A212FLE4_DANPL|nr:hypothetical protein KGM_211060 [Danaus plexippus plexippus]